MIDKLTVFSAIYHILYTATRIWSMDRQAFEGSWRPEGRTELPTVLPAQVNLRQYNIPRSEAHLCSSYLACMPYPREIECLLCCLSCVGVCANGGPQKRANIHICMYMYISVYAFTAGLPIIGLCFWETSISVVWFRGLLPSDL